MILQLPLRRAAAHLAYRWANSEVVDVMRHADFLSQGGFRRKTLHVPFDIAVPEMFPWPKEGEEVRELAVFHPLDEVLYLAGALAATDHLEQRLGATVFSHRIIRPADPSLILEPFFAAWARYQSAAWAAFWSGYDVLGYQDIRRFYDHVTNDRMLAFLRAEGSTAKPIHLISSVLRASSAVCPGLPQGTPGSDLLANVYLASVDAAVRSCFKGFYARYSDDQRFLSTASDDVVAAMTAAAEAAKRLGLPLRLEKTRLVEGEGTYEALHEMAALRNRYGVLASADLVQAELEEMFREKVVLSENMKQRDLRRLVGSMGAETSPFVLHFLIGDLSRFSNASKEIGDLLVVAQLPDDIAIELLSHAQVDPAKTFEALRIGALRGVIEHRVGGNADAVRFIEFLGDERVPAASQGWVARAAGEIGGAKKVRSLRDAVGDQILELPRTAIRGALAGLTARGRELDAVLASRVRAHRRELMYSVNFLQTGGRAPSP